MWNGKKSLRELSRTYEHRKFVMVMIHSHIKEDYVSYFKQRKKTNLKFIHVSAVKSLGTIKAYSCEQHDHHPQIEFDFVKKHIHYKWSSLSTTHIFMYMFLMLPSHIPRDLTAT